MLGIVQEENTGSRGKEQGFESLLTELTTRFVNLRSGSLDELIKWAIIRIGKQLRLDQVWILIFNPKTELINKWYAWNEPEYPVKINLPDESLEPFPWTLEHIRSMKFIRIDSVSNLPPEAANEKETYTQAGYQSILQYPFQMDENNFGLISFIRIKRGKPWTVKNFHQQKLISDALAIGITRAITEAELNKTILRYQTLYNHSPISIWEEDFSQAKAALKSIDYQNSEELSNYLREHPSHVDEILNLIKVVDVNETTMKLWQHTDRNNLLGNLKTTMRDENLDRWIDEIVAISENRLYYLIENQFVAAANGDIKHVNIYWSVVPGHELDWKQVLISAVDNTRQIETEKSLLESEERLRLLLENAEDIIFLQDLNGKYLYHNGVLRFGMTSEDILGKYPSDLYEPKVAEEIMQSVVSTILNRKPVVVEIPFNWDSETRWYSNLVYPVISMNGVVVAVGTICRNITEKRQTEQALANAQKSLSFRIAELEKHNQEISLLSEMLTTLQFSADVGEAHHVISQVLEQLFLGLNGSLLEVKSQDQEQDVIPDGEDQPAPQILSVLPDDCWAIRYGKAYYVEDTSTNPVCQHIREKRPNSSLCIPYFIDGTPAGCLHLETTAEKKSIPESDRRLAQTTTEQIGLALTNIRLRIKLEKQAIHDALTGLYNRHYLDETINRELYRQERSNQPLSLIMIDLDHLKQINDIYGHAAGDAVIRELAKLLKRSVRVSDIPCRYGGDEFLLVMPDTNLETALRRANRIADEFRKLSIPFGTQTLGEFTLSMGVSCSTLSGHTSQDLMSAADKALYQAKGAGRDRVFTAENPNNLEKPAEGLA
jgi:diguanylate cyclase (GGDEF)-like protein/PAS domain S-box-containing protein